MSDRKQLEEAAARELYCTWKVTGEKVMTDARKKFLNRLYGFGAVDRIQRLMMLMHKEELQ